MTEAEVSMNVNKPGVGNLGLTAGEESEVVAFLKTLSDGYHESSLKGLANMTISTEQTL
jgi:hypothetical protein